MYDSYRKLSSYFPRYLVFRRGEHIQINRAFSPLQDTEL